MIKSESVIKIKQKYIEIKDFSIYTDKRKEYLLKGINLTLSPGEIITIRGCSGSGKSLFLKWLVSFPLSRELTTYGRKEINGKIYRVAQEPYMQLFSSTVEEEFVLFKKEEKEYYLSFFDIDKLKKRKISTLSSGEKKIISLIKAFLYKTDILLLDEPFAYLDDQKREKLKLLIKKESEQGRGFIITDHTGINLEGETYILANGRLENNEEIPDNISNFFITNSKNPLLKIRNLSINLNNNTIWNNFTFSVPEGNLIGIIGENGSGKTTLLRYIAGWIKSKQGNLIIEDKEWKRRRDRRSKLAFISTNPETQLYKNTVKEELLSLKIDFLSLERWNLEKVIDLPIKYLSFGEKIRFNSLIGEHLGSKIILLDDIYPALDKENRLLLNNHINNWLSKGKTVFFTNTDPINSYYTINAGRYG